MKPIVIIIAMPTGAGTYVVPGSGTSTCSDCGKKVSIAPATVKLMGAAHEVDYCIKCLKCARETIGNDPNPTFMPPTPAQVAEVRAALKVPK